MRMVFLCGHCRGKLAADSSHSGQPLKCPRCEAVVECPAPNDPGYEFVTEPEPEPAPPPRREREREPEPRRKSSRRLVVRGDRPIRRGKREVGSGTKAALLLTLIMIVIAGVVTWAILHFAGRTAPLADAPPSGWEWQSGTGYRVLVPSKGTVEDADALMRDQLVPGAAARMEAKAKIVDGVVFTWGRQPAAWETFGVPRGQSAALLERMIARKGDAPNVTVGGVMVLDVNGHPARDVSISTGQTELHIRFVVVGDSVVHAGVGGSGLGATDKWVKRTRESLTVR